MNWKKTGEKSQKFFGLYLVSLFIKRNIISFRNIGA